MVPNDCCCCHCCFVVDIGAPNRCHSLQIESSPLSESPLPSLTTNCTEPSRKPSLDTEHNRNHSLSSDFGNRYIRLVVYSLLLIYRGFPDKFSLFDSLFTVTVRITVGLALLGSVRAYGLLSVPQRWQGCVIPFNPHSHPLYTEVP